MKLSDRLKDSLAVGILIGFILIPGFYFLAQFIRSLIVSMKGDQYILQPPTVQLIALLFSIIVFRILMINWKKENIGKGFLMVVMIAVITYFFIYYRIKN